MPQWPFGDIGPCEVVYDYGEVGEVTLSPFLGTVALRLSDSMVDVQEEAYGDTAVDAVFSGIACELDVPLTRQEYIKLTQYVPGTTLQSGALTFSAFMGCGMYADAVEVVLKPMCDGVVEPDTLKWIQVFKAAAYRDFELTFDRSGQRVMMIKFKCFVDLTTGMGGRVFRLGIPYSESGYTP